MNIAPDINNYLRSIDLFRSMIISNNRSKVRDDHYNSSKFNLVHWRLIQINLKPIYPNLSGGQAVNQSVSQ